MKTKLLLLICFIVISCKKQNSNENLNTKPSDPCENSNSYSQGMREGRGQRGMLTDCQTYYPYQGWADDYDCWCKGFNEGRK